MRAPGCQPAPLLVGLIIGLVVVPCTRVTANPRSDEQVIDGIAVLVNPVSSDESQSTVILRSDIDLVLRLILVARYGSKWSDVPVTNAMNISARRVAVLVQLMSRMASTLGVELDRQALIETETALQDRAGGQEPLDRLVQSCGIERNELRYWLGSFQLAQQQLDYLMARTVPLDDAELKNLYEQGGHPFEGATYEEARNAYQRLVRNETKRDILATWLRDLLNTGRVSFAP